MKFEIVPNVLHFKQKAGTSRGVYTERKVWYVHVVDQFGRRGVGECAPLPQLSCDDMADADYERLLREFANAVTPSVNAVTPSVNALTSSDIRLCNKICLPSGECLSDYPSMLFGIESALWHYNSGGVALSDTAFSRGERGISINGLIWMGSFDEMKERIDAKLKDGYRCVKLKIGAINFDDEMELLRMIRSRYSRADVELRVDANGAFKPGDDALRKLDVLSRLDLHSIEQPIMAGQWEEMARLCRNTPLPIALDEELIGVNSLEQKRRMLDEIAPQYIILKPSLHGGLHGGEEWLSLAEERGIGWWITSALESNVGLNAIAHWCAVLQEGASLTGVKQGFSHPIVPQGLGTGMLFTDNVPYPLVIETRNDGVPSLFFVPSAK